MLFSVPFIQPAAKLVLGRTIYYSDGEVEVPERYCRAIIEVVKQSSFIAAIKREVINQLGGC